MSDENPDVVPQESVVDSPDTYEAPETPTEPAQPAPDVEVADDDEGPVSLDAPEPDPAEETGEGEENPENQPEEEPEVEEFDFGGNKLEVKKGDVPPEVAERLHAFSKDIWADYTKKSQANAETAKTLKAREESLSKIESLGGEALDAFVKGKSIKAEIEQLSQIDLQSLWRSNPDQARQISDRLSGKQAELQSIIQAVDQHEQQLSQARQEELARRADEGRQLLDRKYKGFSKEIAPKLEAYAIQSGIPEHEASTWAASPVVAEFAYKAMLYDQMRAAGTPQPAPKKPASPVRAMPNKGGNRQSVNQNDMSFEELGKALGIPG